MQQPNDWIEWKGGKMPVTGDTLVHVRFKSDEPSSDYASASGDRADEWFWAHYDHPGDIIAYRLAKASS